MNLKIFFQIRVFLFCEMCYNVENVFLRGDFILKNGLSSSEVEERVRKGLVNHDTSVPTKSVKQILARQFFYFV